MAWRLAALIVFFVAATQAVPTIAAAQTKKSATKTEKSAKADDSDDGDAPKDKGLVIKATRGKPQKVRIERDGKVIDGMLIHLNSRGLRMKVRGRGGLVAVNLRPTQVTWVEIEGKKYAWDADNKTFALYTEPAKDAAAATQ